MRVLLTTDTVGGVWTFARELSKALLDRGHQVAVFSCGRLPSRSQESWVSTMRKAWGGGAFEFNACGVPLEWMERNEGAYRDGEAALLGVARRFGPDILHASQFCWGALPLSVPKLITAHSDVLSWAASCRPGGLEASPWLDRYRGLVQSGLDGADAVSAPTEWMLGALGANFALPPVAEAILNGRWIDEEPAMDAGRQVTAITAGRFWDEAKNVRLLTEIHSPLPIQIAGEIPQDSPRLTSLGVLDDHALGLAFRTASIYICPSLYEPFGLAPLEAALCGCAVAANDIPSLREVWGECALYFEGAGELEKLLARLVSSPRELAEAQGRSQARARELTRDRMAEAYVALYQQVSVRVAAHA